MNDENKTVEELQDQIRTLERTLNDTERKLKETEKDLHDNQESHWRTSNFWLSAITTLILCIGFSKNGFDSSSVLSVILELICILLGAMSIYFISFFLENILLAHTMELYRKLHLKESKYAHTYSNIASILSGIATALFFFAFIR